MEALGGEKSMYASSRTKTPFQNGLVRERRVWTEGGKIRLPVGLPGEVTSINFIVGSDFSFDTISVSMALRELVLFRHPFARTCP